MSPAPTIDITMLACSESRISHNVKSWLPHARRIIVVVGGTEEAARAGLVGPVDSVTLKAVRAVPDPNKQIIIIHRDRYWKDKNEMAEAANESATSDIVWQVDADEYYLPEDIEQARSELSNADWTLAAMPHVVFWRDLAHVLRTEDGNDWFVPARIWRRCAGEVFLHLPFATLRRANGSTESVGVRILNWGRCYHASWCPPSERVRFKLAFHKARGSGAPSDSWIRDVWELGSIPASGVHPAQPGLFPQRYSGPIPEALKSESLDW